MTDAVSEPATRRDDMLVAIGVLRAWHGVPPSYKEIGALLGYQSPNAVRWHIQALIERGLVTARPNVPRSVVLTPLGRERLDHLVPVVRPLPLPPPIPRARGKR